MQPRRLDILIKIIGLLVPEKPYPFTETHAARDATDLYEAKALIELLESHDCGSYGGFDVGAPAYVQINLLTRTHWLLNKYHRNSDLPKETLKRWKSVLSVHNKLFQSFKSGHPVLK